MLRPLLLACALALLGASTAGAQGDDFDWDAMPVEAETPSRPEAREPEEAEDLEGDAFGSLSLQLRWFPMSPAVPTQPEWANVALAYQPGVTLRLDDSLAFRAVGFLRADQHDDQRTRLDLREAYAQLSVDHVRATIGIQRVFWGVTESRHLVDTINQTDYAEDLSGDTKLGQPMVFLAFDTGLLGVVDVIATSAFRPRRYPGPGGRPGLPLRLLEPSYQAALGIWNVDVALRWSHSVERLDWALSYFYGTARQPELLPEESLLGPAFRPHYALVHQGGLEAQYTVGSTLFKLEAMLRDGQGPPFFAMTGGAQHTFSQVFGTAADLALFLEYNYDGRTNATFNYLDNDLFAAARLSVNDRSGAELTAGVLIDTATGSILTTARASWRPSDDWKVVVDGRIVSTWDERDPVYWFRRDQVLQVEVQYHY